jgi:hypothetical protein
VRGNGLSASAYVAVADLDPGTADALLAALRDRGVAAYAAASPEPVPDGDTDRLYVDVAAVEQARALITIELRVGDDDTIDDLAIDHLELVETRGPDRGAQPDDLDDLDMDAEFAAIVAAFHSSAGGTGEWPASEDLGGADGWEPDGPLTGQVGSSPAGDDRPAGPGTPGATAIGWEDLLRPLPAPEPEPEPGYVPPPPPPLPETSLGTRFAWAAVLGGPALLFAAVLLGWHLADWVMLAAALAFLGGFVALVARLGDRPDDPDDDGAVV